MGEPFKADCPHCGHWASRVQGGHITSRGYLRYRRCLQCRKSFSTTERVNPLHGRSTSCKNLKENSRPSTS